MDAAMKTFLPVCLLVSLSVPWMGCGKSEGASTMEAAIREQMGKPEGALNQADFDAVKQLEIQPGMVSDNVKMAGAITDLTMVGKCKNLEVLDLGKNKIKSLKPLAGLLSLKKLVLPKNQISSVAPLAGLANLEVLELSYNQIKDPMPLSGLKKLYHVNLSGNPIDQSVIDQLKKALPEDCDVVFEN